MKRLLILLAALSVPFLLMADDDVGAVRLHALGKEFSKIKPGPEDFKRPVRAVALNFQGGVRYLRRYADRRVNLRKISPRESKRVQSLLENLVKGYLPYYGACQISARSDWELVIYCDLKTGLEMDETYPIEDLPGEDGALNIGKRRFIYPTVRGSYYLIDKKSGAVVTHNDITGTGSVIDTAIDDFAKKLVLDFSRYTVKE